MPCLREISERYCGGGGCLWWYASRPHVWATLSYGFIFGETLQKTDVFWQTEKLPFRCTFSEHISAVKAQHHSFAPATPLWISQRKYWTLEIKPRALYQERALKNSFSVMNLGVAALPDELQHSQSVPRDGKAIIERFQRVHKVKGVEMPVRGTQGMQCYNRGHLNNQNWTETQVFLLTRSIAPRLWNIYSRSNTSASPMKPHVFSALQSLQRYLKYLEKAVTRFHLALKVH